MRCIPPGIQQMPVHHTHHHHHHHHHLYNIDPGAGELIPPQPTHRARRSSSQEGRRAQASKLEHTTGRKNKRQVETVKYLPRGRVEDWDGAAVRRDVDKGGDNNADWSQGKSTAHVGRANHKAASTGACGARVE